MSQDDLGKQFELPVMDLETGQETYMISDPETAQNTTNGQQQVMVVDINHEVTGVGAAAGDHVHEGAVGGQGDVTQEQTYRFGDGDLRYRDDYVKRQNQNKRLIQDEDKMIDLRTDYRTFEKVSFLFYLIS